MGVGPERDLSYSSSPLHSTLYRSGGTGVERPGRTPHYACILGLQWLQLSLQLFCGLERRMLQCSSHRSSRVEQLERRVVCVIFVTGYGRGR
jgi:hypothetical protein